MGASQFDFDAADRPDEVDLRGVGAALLRRKKWIGGATLAALALALAFSALVTPRYMAQSRLLVENQPGYLIGADLASREQAPDSEAVNSQIQLLTSRDLARKAIKQLDLRGNAEFDPEAGGFSALTRPLVLLGLMQNPADNVVEDRLLTAFFDHLAVYSPTKTRVLQVEFTSENPDLAARGANVVADLYMDLQTQAKRDAAHQAVQTLKPLIASLEARVAEADAQVEAFRAKSSLFEGANNANVSTQQLGEINAQLALARAAQSDAQAKAQGLRQLLQRGRVGDVGDIANNDLVRRVAEQRVALRSQLALESRALLPGHPRIKELEAQLSDIEAQLRAAVERAARGLENDGIVAAARVANLTTLLDMQKQTVATSNVDETQLRELQRVAKTLRDQLENQSAKYQAELALDAPDAAPADARIISRALSPSRPVFPKILPIAIFATLAGLFFSAGAVIVGEIAGGRSDPAGRPAPEPPRDSGGHPVEALGKAGYSANKSPAAEAPATVLNFAPAAAVEIVAAPPEAPLAVGWRRLKQAVAHFTRPLAVKSPQEGVESDAAFQTTSTSAAAAQREPDLLASPAFSSAARPPLKSWAAIGRPVEVVSSVAEPLSPAKSDFSALGNPPGLPPRRVIVSRALVERLAPLSRRGGAKILLVADAAKATAGAHLTLARAMAREGRAVLAQFGGDDEVLRRALAPEAGQAPPGSPPVGLAQLLKGEASFAEVIYRDAFSRLHIVLAGGPVEAPEPGLRLILDALEQTYDMLLIVAPNDAIGQSLAAEADLVLIFGEAGTVRDEVHDDFVAAGAREVLLADIDLQGEIVESAA